MSYEVEDLELEEVERLLEALTRPLFVWRMARGIDNPYASPSQYPNASLLKSAQTRRKNALKEIRDCIDEYVAVRDKDKKRTELLERVKEPGHYTLSPEELSLLGYPMPR